MASVLFLVSVGWVDYILEDPYCFRHAPGAPCARFWLQGAFLHHWAVVPKLLPGTDYRKTTALDDRPYLQLHKSI